MGFFDRFFSLRKTLKKESIDFKDLESWLKERLSMEEAKAYDVSKQSLKEIAGRVRKIQTIVGDIDARDYPKDVPERIRKIIVNSKPKYVESMRDVLKPMEKQPEDYPELKAFQATLSETLSSIAKINLSHGRYLPVAYGDQLLEIQRTAKTILRENNKILENINSAKIVELAELIKEYGELKECIAEYAALEFQLKSIKESISEAESRRDRLSKDYDTLMSGQEFEKIREKEEKAREINDRIIKTESQVHAGLTPLSRVMRKFQKISSEDERISDAVERYIENPTKKFLTEEDDSLNIILNEIRRHVSEGKIDSGEKDKTLVKLDAALQCISGNIRKEYSRLCCEKASLKDEIASSKVLAAKKKTENDIAEKEREIKSKAKDAEETRRKIQKNSEKQTRLTEQLRTRLKEHAEIVF